MIPLCDVLDTILDLEGRSLVLHTATGDVTVTNDEDRVRIIMPGLDIDLSRADIHWFDNMRSCYIAISICDGTIWFSPEVEDMEMID